MEIPFIKMHGLGNNYIFIDTFKFNLEEDMLPALARKVSDPHTGIGSDGLILIHPSDQAEVGMRIFNKDGSEGRNCGNGLRCVAKYAYEYGLVNQTSFKIEAKSGVVEASVSVEDKQVTDITIDMGKPKLERSLIPMAGPKADQVVAEQFEVSHHPLELTAVSMGNPHAVFFVEDIQTAPVHELGPIITDDQRFPEGVNVEFVEVVSEQEVHFRVWERGSGITQACGTGACAAGVAAVLNGYARKNSEILVHLSGGDLIIRWDEEDRVWMTGPAAIIAEGTYHY
ncbi:diaminopimelate epimerase [Thalassobacillus devorans]|uniref:Diaminopimelate epimerase n=1 Tax=Thalassobacillus devorans TaxID=279813 RepID=A0ABQ1NPH9_9BACI|nr:diaminopimelate epimerase [Thalassobacillus devorans]NIK29064.1 diaminopimelate epimerase [Thalassobacillus devorans]GGC81435.1 diaminopimelate epimerase [Thalassobacillus devorans]